ncbi:siderophore-interacting protein [Aurantimonas endophytica]|uniref:NADPH-dependent ferric siderophore reductase n=1 Tax=Aurantimonas endophytica TaxID=1522175 RepID=A0A7W6HEA6_9HYPH|nr:siderophore-interacting protein [Aurantimonas endophytica]MBB4003578.1 NADPH-dependent ferric siderophore reductase [Aurantimonas endophytica]MCO6404436.1 DUF2218 domain-containing protein [Aurantimonas endophytica]
MLTATCDLPAPEPEKLLGLFCEHYVEHGAVQRRGAAGRIVIPYGRFAILASATGLSVRARADDETNLTYVKWGIVSHLQEFLGEAAPSVRWTGDGASEGTPAFWRELRVISTSDVTPCMRRVVLAGNDLERFDAGGLHVRLFFPPAGRPLRGPVLAEDGCPVWPQGEDMLTPRVYTIRAIDPASGQLSIDILRHDGDATPGSSFAVNAAPGDVVGMAGPLGDAGVPPGQRLFFFGDETAIPAIDRILRRLPASVRAHVVIEVGGPAEEQKLTSAAAFDVTWLHRGGGRRLADVATELTADTLGPDGFVWAGCEHADFVAIRRHCRAVLGLPRERHRVAAYWRKGVKGE